jgi:hypothetical protein
MNQSEDKPVQDRPLPPSGRRFAVSFRDGYVKNKSVPTQNPASVDADRVPFSDRAAGSQGEPLSVVVVVDDSIYYLFSLSKTMLLYFIQIRLHVPLQLRGRGPQPGAC